MKEALLVSETTIVKQSVAAYSPTVESYSPTEVFFCPEESQFYSQCLEKMVFNQCTKGESVIEFGTGDGSPIINCLLKVSFDGLVHGYELNPSACELARSRSQQYKLSHKYIIHNTCFFQGLQSSADYLIANPPYLPAPDSNICMPSLHGGEDGAEITKKLLTVGCEKALLMISAYSNPVETIEYAIAQGYQVNDFLISPLKFGYYSCEPKVKNSITELKQQRKAFYSENIYFLAGVLFAKRQRSQPDLSNELIKVMTAL
ncbi:SAM-dependent methyltransferase [Pantanalinema rosaneae CENA516]|uniref:SAM-dependent methyltransferase n=1 Tax=Pantanalinema rosaneae TaxID=1620701 RepID=UPI003D700355